jgi:hypothetical protein
LKYFGFLFRRITCGQELFLKISFSFVSVLVFLGMACSCDPCTFTNSAG